MDVFISYEDYTEENYSLKYNAGLAEQYMTYLKEMAEQFGIENDVRVSTLSPLSGRLRDGGAEPG